MNYNKIFSAMQEGDKLPRKAKKWAIGKKLSKKKLNKLLDSVVIKEGDISPYPFCPKCGCKAGRSTGNMVEYPEHWQKWFCVRCNFLVCEMDNSKPVHALECKQDNYEIWI